MNSAGADSHSNTAQVNYQRRERVLLVVVELAWSVGELLRTVDALFTQHLASMNRSTWPYDPTHLRTFNFVSFCDGGEI